MQTIFAVLRYNDARAAIRFLCAAFGFVELFSVPESGPVVRHAQLRLGTNIIMLGAATQALCVYVEDLGAHFERARAAGAHIVAPPAGTDFGAREYHALDVEGHPWTFGTYLPAAGRG
ncbi:MAG: VOC family protein [Pyrinomonadaceae bacterium]